MKLRIYRDSLRFRLSPADLARLNERGIIVETTRFGPHSEFSYLLRIAPTAVSIRATLGCGVVCVEIPSDIARDWSRGETVSLRHSQLADSDKMLDILIEKDFECLESPVNKLDDACAGMQMLFASPQCAVESVLQQTP